MEMVPNENGAPMEMDANGPKGARHSFRVYFEPCKNYAMVDWIITSLHLVEQAQHLVDTRGQSFDIPNRCHAIKVLFEERWDRHKL